MIFRSHLRASYIPPSLVNSGSFVSLEASTEVFESPSRGKRKVAAEVAVLQRRPLGSKRPGQTEEFQQLAVAGGGCSGGGDTSPPPCSGSGDVTQVRLAGEGPSSWPVELMLPKGPVSEQSGSPSRRELAA